MLTHDKPRVCVSVCACTSVTQHMRTHSEWHTSYLTMLVMILYFELRSSFQPLLLRMVQQPEVLNNTTPCNLERSSSCICDSELSSSSSAQRGVDCRRRRNKHPRCLAEATENLKLPSHCDALSSVWEDAEAAAGSGSKLTGTLETIQKWLCS